MARTSDLTVRAALDIAGVTRGVDLMAREMARANDLARQSFGDMAIPDLTADARRTAESLGHTFGDTLTQTIDADRQRIADSLGSAVGDAASGAAREVETAAAEAQAAVGALNAEVSARPPLLYWDEWAAQVRSAKAAAQEMETVQEELGDATRQSTRWTEQSVRDQDRIQEEYKQTWLAARQAKEGIQTAGAQTAATAGQVGRLGTSSRRATDGLGRLNNSMVVIARQAANAHPAVGQLVDVVGTFALGTGVMVAVLAGLAAIATAWNRITRDAKEAQRAQEEAGERAKSILGDLQLEDFGPGGQAAADLVAINEQIETMRRTIDAVRQTGQQDPFTLGVVGLAPGGAAKDIEKLQDQLSDLVGQRLALLETVRRAEERAGDERQREIEDEQRQIERLIEARTRMVQILGAASISSPFGEFNVSDIGGKLEESFRETEELRGHIRGLTDAMDDLISMGEEVPAGSIQLLSRLQQALADADADVQRRVTRLKERWEEFQTVTIRSEVTPPQIIIPAIVDPFSLTALEDTFENATAAIQERFVRGVIDQDAFEQQGREAAQRFNDAILAKIDQLRADGRLAEALELALQLKLDVEVPDSAAFNDTIEAVRNVTSGIRDLADALGDMSPQLSAALRSVDSFINGINQIQAGRETGGTIGALSQVSGVLGIAAGVFQIFQGLDAAKRAEEEQARRMAEQTRESVRALADFAKGLEDATQFDRHYEDLADATRKALLDAFRETQAGRGVSEEQIGIDVQNLEDFIDAEGIQALLESWKKFGGIWAEIAGEYEAAAAKIEEVRQREISRMLEDIEVRALVAQGRDSEAAVLRQAIQHEKELAEARALGFTAEQIARLEEVQAMEKVAEAAKEVSNALRGVPQGFRILNLELIRFNAMQAETADTSPTDPGTPVQPPTPTGPTQPGGPTDTGPGGRQTPGGPVFNIDDNRTYRFEIAQQPGESPAQFADRVRVIVREMDRQDDLLFDGFTRAAQR